MIALKQVLSGAFREERMLDLYLFDETRRLELATLERRLLRRAEQTERSGEIGNSSRRGHAEGTVGAMSLDPMTLEAMARLDREAEATHERLVREAQGSRRSVRVALARALRTLATRLDGGIGVAPEPNGRLVGV